MAERDVGDDLGQLGCRRAVEGFRGDQSEALAVQAVVQADQAGRGPPGGQQFGVEAWAGVAHIVKAGVASGAADSDGDPQPVALAAVAHRDGIEPIGSAVDPEVARRRSVGRHRDLVLGLDPCVAVGRTVGVAHLVEHTMGRGALRAAGSQPGRRMGLHPRGRRRERHRHPPVPRVIDE